MLKQSVWLIPTLSATGGAKRQKCMAETGYKCGFKTPASDDSFLQVPDPPDCVTLQEMVFLTCHCSLPPFFCYWNQLHGANFAAFSVRKTQLPLGDYLKVLNVNHPANHAFHDGRQQADGFGVTGWVSLSAIPFKSAPCGGTHRKPRVQA